MNSQLRIGISGWTYAPWRGVFYPPGLPHDRELHYASGEFDTIEINGTHYSLQRPETFRKWYEQTPEHFVFSIKGSRYITHVRRLKDVKTPMANFFASGVLALGEKTGPFLWQLPPSLHFDPKITEAFLALLPGTTDCAAKLARQHDGKLKGRAVLKARQPLRLRHCMEVRHASFMVPEFFSLLRQYRVAFGFADTAGKWPYAEEFTSDFAYIRLHGDKQIYVSGYTDDALREWARKIQRWRRSSERHKKPTDTTETPRSRSSGRDVYVYFDNDTKVRAPADARKLSQLLNG